MILGLNYSSFNFPPLINRDLSGGQMGPKVDPKVLQDMLTNIFRLGVQTDGKISRFVVFTHNLTLFWPTLVP